MIIDDGPVHLRGERRQKTTEDSKIGALKAGSRKRLGGELDSFETPYVVLASPGWRGVEADIYLARSGARAEIVKSYRPETDFYIDVPASLHAACSAGTLGIGPRVVAQEPEAGVLIMEYLGEGWRTAGLHDAANAATRAAVIEAKKRFQAGPRCRTDGNTFAQIRELANIVETLGLLCPPALPAWLTFADEAEARIRASGADSRPCHRDGNIANVMVGPAGAVRLLDYDLSANADPYEDLGCFLMEMYDTEAARAGFEEWIGSFHEGEFLRAWAYGVIDDLRWGLIGTVMTARSPRLTLEFSKYASWRLMRFEDHMKRLARLGSLQAMA